MVNKINSTFRKVGLLSILLITTFLFSQTVYSESNASGLSDVKIKVNEVQVTKLAYGIGGEKVNLTLSSAQPKWVKMTLDDALAINLMANADEPIQELTEKQSFDLDDISIENDVFRVRHGYQDSLYLKLDDKPTTLEILRPNDDESKIVVEDAENGDSKEVIHFLSASQESEQRNENFSITPNISRLSGTAPMDATDEPGYDSDQTNNRLRTFDTAAYTVQGSINMLSTQYSELRIQLESRIDDAWRLDSSGKVRQTAEIVNGEISNNNVGPYTKKSVHVSNLRINGGTGQFYFTETIQAFGGVNEDEIHTKFAVTVLSGTTIDGKEVTINQRIDQTTDARLQDKLYLSAKANVDVIMRANQNQMNEFDNLITEGTLPNTIVKGVGVYAQLKPLPNREDATSLKGSTYPEGGINYSIKQQVFYQSSANSSGRELQIGEDTQPVQAIYYRGGPSGGRPTYTPEFSEKYGVYTPLSEHGTKVPYGYTRNVFPPSDVSANAGIFDTGFPSAANNQENHTIDVVNNDYLSVSTGKNKKFFSGEAMPADSEPFSVVYMQMVFPYSYIVDQAHNVGQLKYHLFIDEITYEGQTQEVKASTDVIWDKKWPGSFVATTSFTDSDHKGLSSIGSDGYYKSNGDGMTAQGNQIWSSHYTNGQSVFGKETVMYARWNANSFKYDSERSVSPATEVTQNKLKQMYYGVGVKVPDVSLRNEEAIDNSYTWYETVEEAEAQGEIVAIKSIFGDNNGNNAFRIRVPLKVVGPVGVLDETGKENVAYTNGFLYDVNQQVIFQVPSETSPNYRPTQYDEHANITHEAVEIGSWGDTLFINQLLIRPVITTDKKNYNPTDKVKWTVRSDVSSGYEGVHKVTHHVTLPKETVYVVGSAKDEKGQHLPDPVITEQQDGTKTLLFTVDYNKSDGVNPSLTFETSIISSLLVFENNQFTLEGKVLSEIEAKDNPEIKDLSPESRRKSSTTATVSNSGSIVIDKVADKAFIESGNQKDVANPSVEYPTDIKYTISYRNHSSNQLTDVRILDVLPFNGDTRGTSYSGSYETLEVHSTSGDGDIWYTLEPMPVDTDPNLINLQSPNWSKLTEDMSVLKRATAVMVVYPELKPGELLSYSIKIRPDSQKAGDSYVNSPVLNSNINQYVHGMTAMTKVLGRELTGKAWYDDDLDGLIGEEEEVVPNVPVKLYRTSQENDSYSKELVKSSLTGEKWIDEAGNSLVKTDSQGNYSFKNLPEGKYIVEFDVLQGINNETIQITHALVGDDVTKNSKADSQTGRTSEYTAPLLKELPSLVDDTSRYTLRDVNIGLIRPSEVSLYKYAAGTASKGEEASGQPLAGAEFDLYDAKTDTKLATGTTDTTGWVNFSELFPGNYYLVETKSPNGFELIKKKINFEIKTGNEQVVLYQDDESQTKLPFTGGGNWLPVLLVVSMGSVMLGVIIMVVNRRRGNE